MIRFLKIIFITAVSISIVTSMDSCRTRYPSDSYLDMKIKPNTKQLRADKKIMRKSSRAYKRHMGNSRKSLFGRRKAPGT